jgi:hypothetical protein
MPHRSTFGTGYEISRYDLHGTVFAQHALAQPVGDAALLLMEASAIVMHGKFVVVADYRVDPQVSRLAPDSTDRLEAGPRSGVAWTALGDATRRWLTLVHDALVVVDPPGREYFAVYQPDTQEVSAVRVPPAQAATSLEADIQGAVLLPDASDASRLAAYHTTVNALVHDHGLRVYRVAWDNNDDTDRNGLIAVHPDTGELRALVVINPP